MRSVCLATTRVRWVMDALENLTIRVIPSARRSARPFLAILLLGWLAMFGCKPLKVTSPKPNQVTSQDFELVNDKIRIRVEFNRAVDFSSLAAGRNVILVTEKDENAGIVISRVAANVIRIDTVAVLLDLFDFDPNGFFKLRLLGNGPEPVRDTRGTALDGDKDGTAGGIYETQFLVLG